MAPEAHTFALPLPVATPVDIGRVLRELEHLHELIMQAELRKETDIKLPKTSLLLDRLLQSNKAQLLDANQRAYLLDALKQIKDTAPVLHMSFSADPAPAFVEKLMTWLRREIHPYVLLTIGLQPSLGAGCIVRSRNKQFDLSLRQDMLAKRDLLLQAMQTNKSSVTPPPAPQPTTPAGVAA